MTKQSTWLIHSFIFFVFVETNYVNDDDDDDDDEKNISKLGVWIVSCVFERENDYLLYIEIFPVLL